VEKLERIIHYQMDCQKEATMITMKRFFNSGREFKEGSKKENGNFTIGRWQLKFYGSYQQETGERLDEIKRR